MDFGVRGERGSSRTSALPASGARIARWGLKGARWRSEEKSTDSGERSQKRYWDVDRRSS